MVSFHLAVVCDSSDEFVNVGAEPADKKKRRQRTLHNPGILRHQELIEEFLEPALYVFNHERILLHADTIIIGLFDNGSAVYTI